jgi:hypothetical protein
MQHRFAAALLCLAVLLACAHPALAQFPAPKPTGGGSGAIGTPYTATGTGTSVSITAATHGKGTKPIWGTGSCVVTATGAAPTAIAYVRDASTGDVSASWTGSVAYTCDVWASGQQGTSGSNGADGGDGDPACVAWADDSSGTGFSRTTPKDYMAVKTLADCTATVVGDFTGLWKLVKGTNGTNGTNGANGTNGVNGTDGADGSPACPAWADADDGTGFSLTVPKDYFAVANVAAGCGSAVESDFTGLWKLASGAPGAPGTTRAASCTATGTTSAIACTTGEFTSYDAGAGCATGEICVGSTLINVKVPSNNAAGGYTIAVDGLVAQAAKVLDPTSGFIDPPADTFTANGHYVFTWTGTYLQPVGSGGAGGSGVSFPSETGHANKALFTNGSGTRSWNRTVKSIALSAGLDLSCTNGADGASGDCTISVDETYLLTADGDNALSGRTSFPTSTAQVVVAGTTVLANATKITLTSAAAVTLTANPIIADSVLEGQKLCILNGNVADAITFTSGTAYNLQLSAATVALPAKQHMCLLWDTALSLWTTQAVGGSSSSSDPNMVTSTTTLTNGAPVVGSSGGTKLVVSGTKTGTTTEFVTQSGAKTSGSLSKYDASGNLTVATAGTDYISASTQHYVIQKCINVNETISNTTTMTQFAGTAFTLPTLVAGDSLIVEFTAQKAVSANNSGLQVVYNGSGLSNSIFDFTTTQTLNYYRLTTDITGSASQIVVSQGLTASGSSPSGIGVYSKALSNTTPAFFIQGRNSNGIANTDSMTLVNMCITLRRYTP